MSKPFSQACKNNQAAICEVLQKAFAASTAVLEVGSGTGQHAAYCAPRLPHVVWQTSDLPQYHAGIAAWLAEAHCDTLQLPFRLDANAPPDINSQYDALFSANTLHIMSPKSVEHFFSKVVSQLKPQANLCVYGPFNYNDQFTSASNARFNDWLAQQNAHSGIRDFEWVNQLATAQGFDLIQDYAMPANNRLLHWRRV